MLKDFTSVPWDHYKNSSLNNMSDSLLINVHNASEVQENYQDGKVEVYKNGSFRGDFVLPGFDLANQSINYPALSTIVSSHDFGFAKQEQAFWHKLSEVINLDKNRAIFFDDSLDVLKSAFEFNIKRIWLHTCSLDHKNALNNYISRGMKIFKTEKINI